MSGIHSCINIRDNSTAADSKLALCIGDADFLCGELVRIAVPHVFAGIGIRHWSSVRHQACRQWRGKHVQCANREYVEQLIQFGMDDSQRIAREI